MKLEFQGQYKSIQSLETVELSDFSIITGLNGTGKTHLLKAIASGRIQIHGFQPQECVYFTYSDFMVNTGDDSSGSTKQNIPQQIANEKRKLYNIHTQHINQLRDRILSEFPDPIDYSIAVEILQPEKKDFKSTIGVKSDFKYFNALEPKPVSTSRLKQIQANVSRQFYDFCRTYVGKAGEVMELDFDVVFQKYNEMHESLEDSFKINDPSYYEFIQSSTGGIESIFNLREENFDSASLFTLELANEVRSYIVRKYTNYHNEILATKENKNVEYLTDEEFVEIYGKNPIDNLNELLFEFDCNGYEFKQVDEYPKPGQDYSQLKVPIELVHKAKGHNCKVEDLSSGEQTLLALSLMIYKARKGRVLPRVLLLDEIDSALHPSMIKKVLNVIGKVFVESRKMKAVMVTHSPTTIALALEEAIYVLQNDEICQIVKKSRGEAISFLTEGFATIEEGLNLLDEVARTDIAIITEGNNVDYLRKANSFFGSEEIEILDNLRDLTGKNQLKSLFQFFLRANHDKKVVFVWDPDVNYNLDTGNNTYPFSFEKNPNNSEVISGIENLFSEDHFTKEFYDSRTKEDGGMVTVLNKTKFASYIIKKGNEEDFALFKPLFDWIQNEVKKG